MSDYTVGCIRQLNECAEGEPIQEIPRSFMVDLRAELQAKDAEIEECNRIISAVCKENGRLLSANVALQAVVDRILEYIDSGGCYLVTVKRIIKQDLALNSGEQE